jgi:hypothetical protein
MRATRETQLMHAVLDGLATPAEERELKEWLAKNPAAQAEFDGLQGLFEHLARVPKIDPPAGLAEEIVKKYAPEKTSSRSAHKLFSWLRVSGISLPTNFWGEFQMSQQAPFARKRLVWAAVSVAVAAVAVGYFVFDIPPSDQVAGTITPAQRYQSKEQIQTKDVKLADQSVVQALQNDAVVKLIKDPNFQAIAKNQAALSAFASNIQAFAALAQQPAAFAAAAANAPAFAALASNAAVFNAVLSNPSAFAQYASNANAFASAAANAASVPAMQANAASFSALAANTNAMAAISANPGIFAAVAANAPAFSALAANTNAMSMIANNPSAFSALGANATAFSQLAAAPASLAALSANGAALAAIQANPSAFVQVASNLSAQGTAASSANLSAGSAANLNAAGSASSQQK